MSKSIAPADRCDVQKRGQPLREGFTIVKVRAARSRDAHACARFAESPGGGPVVRRSREIFAEIDISLFSNLRLTSMVAHSRHAGVMHLVDAATRMQLAATGQVAACVPFL